MGFEKNVVFTQKILPPPPTIVHKNVINQKNFKIAPPTIEKNILKN